MGVQLKTFHNGETWSRWDSSLSLCIGRPWRWSPPWTPPSHLVGWLGLVDSTCHSEIFWMILEPSRTFHKFTGPFPNLEYDFPYLNLILRTIPELLVMSWIPSETPNNIRTPFHIPYLLKTTSNLKCVTLQFANYADMIETLLRSITNSGTWRSIIAPTYSTMTS
jgi:hypothetical protein